MTHPQIRYATRNRAKNEFLFTILAIARRLGSQVPIFNRTVMSFELVAAFIFASFKRDKIWMAVVYCLLLFNGNFYSVLSCGICNKSTVGMLLRIIARWGLGTQSADGTTDLVLPNSSFIRFEASNQVLTCHMVFCSHFYRA